MTFTLLLYQIFIISWFTHLTSRIPFLGLIRFDFILVTILILFAIPNSDTDQPKKNHGIENSLIFLSIYTIITLPFVQWPGSVINFGLLNFLKAIVFYFFTVRFVKTEKQLQMFIFVFLICQTFRILEPLYLHSTDGYWGSSASLTGWEYMDRLSGAPHDTVNPNGLAFVIVTTIPFLYYLSRISKKIMTISLITIPLSIWALILTSSRTGIIALFFLIGLVFFKSWHKFKLVAAVTICIIIVYPSLSAYQKDRYLSIFVEDTKNASTVQGRITGIKNDIQVGLRKPLFGHGLGTSLEANFNYGQGAHPAHNLYVEIFQELGLVGLLIFVYFIYSVIKALRNENRQLKISGTEDTPFIRATWNAVQVFLGVNILFSLASYGLSGYEWYLVPGLISVITKIRLNTSERRENYE